MDYRLAASAIGRIRLPPAKVPAIHTSFPCSRLKWVLAKLKVHIFEVEVSNVLVRHPIVSAFVYADYTGYCYLWFKFDCWHLYLP